MSVKWGKLMLKLKINTTPNYSPNFDQKKRENKDINFIIFHYTGMRSESESLKRLTDIKSKVSCHYFIRNNGEIINVVPDLYIAWHAGISKWKKFNSLNRKSIGIELSNPGHDFNYKKFTNKQIYSIFILCKFLIKKYKIKTENILGHSDIAPNRKKDPGEKFPWKLLSKKKIGLWHSINPKKLINKRKKKTNHLDKKYFIQNLYNIGYPKNIDSGKDKYSKILTKAFQRRFRQELVDGIIDQECLIISKNVIKKKDKFS